MTREQIEKLAREDAIELVKVSTQNRDALSAFKILNQFIKNGIKESCYWSDKALHANNNNWYTYNDNSNYWQAYTNELNSKLDELYPLPF